MSIEIRECGPEVLERYGRIPMRFRVESVLRVEPVDGGLGGLRLIEEAVAEPTVKDYDEDEDVRRWARRFDVTNWGFFVAVDGEALVGGAAVAFRSPKVQMLDGRTDLAVLWDLRVHPDWRRRGVGSRLFERVAAWARARGCRQLKIETQNVNVPACRFYASRGCRLGAIDRDGYAGDPRVSHEAMLLWYLDLDTGAT